MEKTFIKIPNKLFEKDEETGATIFHQIDTKGFTLWCYMLMRQANQTSIEISIKRLLTFLDRDYEAKKRAKKEKIPFKSKAKVKNGLTDARIIKKYIASLIRTNLIKIDNEELNNKLKQMRESLQMTIDAENLFNKKVLVVKEENKTKGNLEKIAIETKEYKDKKEEEVKAINTLIDNYLKNVSINSEILLTVNTCLDIAKDKQYFSIISTALFTDYIVKFGHIGWSMYCLLFKLHNKTFGNQDCSNGFGFADPSRDYIGDILDLSVRIISDYIKILGNVSPKIMKIEVQPKVLEYNKGLGKLVPTQEANHYIVFAKCYNNESKNEGNPYYISTKIKVAG